MGAAVETSYPRTLYLWTKADDKKLAKGIVEGHCVMDLAEDLEREHVSVLRRLNDLDLFVFEDGSEEWVEVMTLGLGGVPLQVVLDWCNASPARLHYSEIAQMQMVDFRAEFELASQLGLAVCSQDAMTDLMWLVSQPDQVRAGYAAAAQAVIDRYDIPTPATLKAQVLGLVPATAPWPLVLVAKPAKKTRSSKSSKGRRGAYRKSRGSYARSTSTRRSSSSKGWGRRKACA